MAALHAEDPEGSAPFLQLLQQHMQRALPAEAEGTRKDAVRAVRPAGELVHAAHAQHAALCRLAARAQELAEARGAGAADEDELASALDTAWQVGRCL
jgi:hypothetical protein